MFPYAASTLRPGMIIVTGFGVTTVLSVKSRIRDMPDDWTEVTYVNHDGNLTSCVSQPDFDYMVEPGFDREAIEDMLYWAKRAGNDEAIAEYAELLATAED
jgi:hypothetical protein